MYRQGHHTDITGYPLTWESILLLGLSGFIGKLERGSPKLRDYHEVFHFPLDIAVVALNSYKMEVSLLQLRLPSGELT